MKKEQQEILWKIIPLIVAVSGWIIQPIIKQDSETLEKMIEAIPYIFFIIGITWFFYLNIKYKIEREIKRAKEEQNESDTAVYKAIMRLRDEKTTLQIICQCLIEDATKSIIMDSKNLKNPVIDSKAQQEIIKENVMKKMDQVFDETKTNPEKRYLIDSLWNIQPDKNI